MNQNIYFSTVLARLRAVKHSELGDVAKESGVPESTLKKIRTGEVKNPRIMTVEALHRYFTESAKK